MSYNNQSNNKRGGGMMGGLIDPSFHAMFDDEEEEHEVIGFPMTELNEQVGGSVASGQGTRIISGGGPGFSNKQQWFSQGQQGGGQQQQHGHHPNGTGGGSGQNNNRGLHRQGSYSDDEDGAGPYAVDPESCQKNGYGPVSTSQQVEINLASINSGPLNRSRSAEGQPGKMKLHEVMNVCQGGPKWCVGKFTRTPGQKCACRVIIVLILAAIIIGVWRVFYHSLEVLFGHIHQRAAENHLNTLQDQWELTSSLTGPGGHEDGEDSIPLQDTGKNAGPTKVEIKASGVGPSKGPLKEEFTESELAGLDDGKKEEHALEYSSVEDKIADSLGKYGHQGKKWTIKSNGSTRPIPPEVPDEPASEGFEPSKQDFASIEEHVADICKGREGKIKGSDMTLYVIFSDPQYRDDCLETFKSQFNKAPKQKPLQDISNTNSGMDDLQATKNAALKRGKKSGGGTGSYSLAWADFQQITFFYPDASEKKHYDSGFPLSRPTDKYLKSGSTDHDAIMEAIETQVRNDGSSLYIYMAAHEVDEDTQKEYRKIMYFATFSLGDIKDVNTKQPVGGAMWRVQIASEYQHRSICPGTMLPSFDLVNEIRYDIYPWIKMIGILDASWSYFTSQHQGMAYEEADRKKWLSYTKPLREDMLKMGDPNTSKKEKQRLYLKILNEDLTPGKHCYMTPFNSGLKEYQTLDRRIGLPDQPVTKVNDYTFPNFGYRPGQKQSLGVFPGIMYYVYDLPPIQGQNNNNYGGYGGDWR